jgi:glycosyltransferase involved in cell wall biosynthesis
MKTGLAISTYFCEKTSQERLGIFRKSIESLVLSRYSDTIILVDDGSTTRAHLEGLPDNVRVVSRPHGGIARAKNTCIKELLNEGVDIGFLADDDVMYKSADWAEQYTKAIQITGMGHFSYFLESTPCEYPEMSGYVYRKTPSVNGCFLTFTRDLIERIGYFKILPHEYGHEHSNFSLRAATIGKQGGFFDIVDSSQRLELIQESIVFKSVGPVDPIKFKENEQQAILTEFKYEPFSE